jgi:hypothetical protein
MVENNPYYDYFKNSLQVAESVEQEGGKFYDPSIGHIYAVPTRSFQRGRGLAGPVYSISGSGFGNILGRLFKWSQPLLRSLGQKVLSSASNIATNVAQDAFQGDNIIESVKKHGSAEGKSLLSNVPEEIGNFISDKTSRQVAEADSLDQTFEESTVPRKRASSGRRNVVKKKRQKINKVNRTQKGRGFSGIYPALALMK